MPATERQCNFSMDIDLKELYNKVKKSRQTYIPADLTDLMSKQSLTESIETMDPTTQKSILQKIEKVAADPIKAKLMQKLKKEAVDPKLKGESKIIAEAMNKEALDKEKSANPNLLEVDTEIKMWIKGLSRENLLYEEKVKLHNRLQQIMMEIVWFYERKENPIITWEMQSGYRPTNHNQGDDLEIKMNKLKGKFKRIPTPPNKNKKRFIRTTD